MSEIKSNAIITRKLCFSYPSGLSKVPVLNCVDMNVPQGQIYGLLGPSGCGKTSLLKVIIGLLKPDAGFVSVFGHQPGSNESGVPGIGVGYMPQEISLQDYLKVNEVFKYFGSIYLKSGHTIDENMHYFLNLLNLNDANAMVRTLSGGQKRRLSLAVAVFAKPRLLILDEPTVGVDPLLSAIIWQFLKRIVSEECITVIVTTHYIEEMKCAQRVAFMREGEILQEDTPANVLEHFRRNSLEEVFFDLSYNQSRRESSVFTRKEVRKMSDEDASRDSITLINQPLPVKSNYFLTNLCIIWTLIWENFIKSSRHSITLLIFLLPVFITFTTSYCIGKMPEENRLGWVVYDSPALSLSNVTSDVDIGNDQYEPYLPELLRSQFNKSVIKLINYDNLTKAIEDVKHTKLIGVIYLPANFSTAFYDRDININQHSDWVDNSTIEAGSVHLRMDMNNPLLGTIIIFETLKKVLTFREEAYEAIGVNKAVSRLPFTIAEAIHGSRDENFAQLSRFTTIGMYTILIYVVSKSVTAMHFQMGNNDDLITRCLSVGVRPHQIIIAATVVNFVVAAASANVNLFFMIYVLKIQCKGYLIYAVINVLLMALCGVTVGLLFGLLIRSTALCNIFASGYTFMLVAVSGNLWPMEAVPYFIKIISLILPIAVPNSAMHKIFDYQSMDFSTYILPGYIVLTAHILLYSCISCYLLHRRR